MRIGIDFGTTNSALCAAFPDGSVRLASFGAHPQGEFPGARDVGGTVVRSAHGSSTTFRSILYCDPERRNADRTPVIVAGPEAIDSSLRAERRGRLILSPKSFLASALFTGTNIYGTSY